MRMYQYKLIKYILYKKKKKELPGCHKIQGSYIKNEFSRGKSEERDNIL